MIQKVSTVTVERNFGLLRECSVVICKNILIDDILVVFGGIS